MMEEKVLSEKESLELIAKMIANTKQNLRVGSGNQFILWGTLGAIVSLVVMTALTWTGNPACNWLWFLIPLIGWPLMMWQLRREQKPVVTYTDKALTAVWRAIGSMGMAGVFLLSIQSRNMGLMLPGVLILMCIGVFISSELLRNRLMAWMSAVSLLLCIVSGVRILREGMADVWWMDHIVFSLCFVLMLVIPGCRLNKEARHV